MKIGIFGGTFDPIHRGHLEAARVLLRTASLDRILFMPTGDPPHKAGRAVTDGRIRLEMVRAAVSHADEPALAVSDFEVRREGYTYTVDTLEALCREKDADVRYFWIIGADVLADLAHWKQCDRVFELCEFLAMYRPGCSRDAFQKEYTEMTARGARITFAEVPPVDISSTEIRDLTASGASVRHLVPDPVAELIEKYGLYRGTRVWTVPEIQADLEKRLSAHRFAHTLGVMREAERLAARFCPEQKEKAVLAGLLHDAAREFTESQYLWIGLDPSGAGSAVLLHGAAAAILAGTRYGIRDAEIEEALRVHTTGKPGMGLLAQILFVADYTEPGRTGAHFDRVRTVLEERGLMAAVAEECTLSIAHLRAKNAVICPDTIETEKWALREMAEQEHNETEA